MDILIAILIGFPLPTMGLCIFQALRGVWTVDRLWNSPRFDCEPRKCLLIGIVILGETAMTVIAHRRYSRRYISRLYRDYQQGADQEELENRIYYDYTSPILKIRALYSLAYWEAGSMHEQGTMK